jgi:hypothetical protein
LIGTSDALCRDAKPRSAILTRLEGSLSHSAHTKLDVIYENIESFKIESNRCNNMSKAHNQCMDYAELLYFKILGFPVEAI